MDQFIIELSKYIFACIALLFLFESYTIYKNNDKKRNSGKDMRQKAYLFLFHFVGYAILYLHTLDIIYVTFLFISSGNIRFIYCIVSERSIRN
jgi:hypothetical protein